MTQNYIFYDFSKAIQQFVLIIHVFCENCDPGIVLTVIQIIVLSAKALDWCSTQYSIQNKLLMVTNLTKCVNQHCCGLEILKKKLICLIFI